MCFLLFFFVIPRVNLKPGGHPWIPACAGMTRGMARAGMIKKSCNLYPFVLIRGSLFLLLLITDYF